MVKRSLEQRKLQMLLVAVSNVGDRLATDIPHVSKSPLDYIDTCNSESFYLFPTTPSEIEREISYLNTSKTVGPNSIPIKVLKLLQHVLSKPLKILFNASFATGIVYLKVSK